jgi:hypothetical protein
MITLVVIVEVTGMLMFGVSTLARVYSDVFVSTGIATLGVVGGVTFLSAIFAHLALTVAEFALVKDR